MPWIQKIQVDSEAFRFIKKIPSETFLSDEKSETADWGSL